MKLDRILPVLYGLIKFKKNRQTFTLKNISGLKQQISFSRCYILRDRSDDFYGWNYSKNYLRCSVFRNIVHNCLLQKL